MRILFINHAFPGVFGELAARFGENPEHEVFFASSYSRHKYAIPGVRHIQLLQDREAHVAKKKDGQELDTLLSIGRQALHSFCQLREKGFVPDMVLASTSGGYSLFWEQAFPRSFRVGWTEGAVSLPDSRALGKMEFVRHLLQCRQALSSDLFVSLTAGWESLYASCLKQGIDLPYSVNTEWFAPGRAERLLHGNTDLATLPELVIFLFGKKYDGDVSCLAAAMLLLEKRPHCHVAILCNGGVSLSFLKQECSDVSPALMERLHIVGTLSLRNYRNLLSIASVLVIQAGFEVTPSIMLEAMSCETALLLPAGCDVPSVMQEGENMLRMKGNEPEDVALYLAGLLEDELLLERICRSARTTVLEHFDNKFIVPQHMDFLLNAYQSWKRESGRSFRGQ